MFCTCVCCFCMTFLFLLPSFLRSFQQFFLYANVLRGCVAEFGGKLGVEAACHVVQVGLGRLEQRLQHRHGRLHLRNKHTQKKIKEEKEEEEERRKENEAGTKRSECPCCKNNRPRGHCCKGLLHHTSRLASFHNKKKKIHTNK